MVDWILARALHVMVAALISGTAAAALVFGYHGLLELFGGHVAGGSIRLAVCPVFGLATHFLARNRDDLMDKP